MQWDSTDASAALELTENTYLILALRYKELASGGGEEDVLFNIAGHLTEIDTDKIDADYMNSRFDKFLRMIEQDGLSGGLFRGISRPKPAAI